MTAKKPTSKRFKSTANNPDGTDVCECINAIYADFSANAELHVYCDLVGGMVVEAVATYVGKDGKSKHFQRWKPYHTNSASLLALSLQCLHALYHDIDWYLYMVTAKEPNALPSGE